MLRRINSDVPNNTNIVILQPGTNDLRFFGSKCLSGNFSLKTLDESRHGLPNMLLSGTSFNFAIWKSESNQTHVSGRTLRNNAPLIFRPSLINCGGVISASSFLTQ